MENFNEINSYAVIDVIDRMKKICNVSQDKELAMIMDITPGGINGWKRRDSVPLEALIKLSKLKNISLDWLVYGTEQKNDMQMSIDEEMLLSAYKKMPKEQKTETIMFVSGLNSHSNNQPVIQQSTGNNGINIGGNANFKK